MTKTQMFEIFLSPNPTRVAAISAVNIYAAHDQAVTLLPGIDWRQIVVVPSTMERVMEGGR